MVTTTGNLKLNKIFWYLVPYLFELLFECCRNVKCILLQYTLGKNGITIKILGTHYSHFIIKSLSFPSLYRVTRTFLAIVYWSYLRPIFSKNSNTSSCDRSITAVPNYYSGDHKCYSENQINGLKLECHSKFDQAFIQYFRLRKWKWLCSFLFPFLGNY